GVGAEHGGQGRVYRDDEGLDSVTFHVPLGCLIILNQEQVRMRMLQPMDRAVIRFTYDSDQLGSEHLVAHSIRIHGEPKASDPEMYRASHLAGRDPQQCPSSANA